MLLILGHLYLWVQPGGAAEVGKSRYKHLAEEMSQNPMLRSCTFLMCAADGETICDRP